MNPKTEAAPVTTENQTSEFSPNFVRTIAGLTVATLLLVFVFEHDVLHLRPYGPRVYMFPCVVAAGYVIGNGLSEFEGKAVPPRTLTERVAVLLSVTIGYLVGPTLFFFGWYYRRKERAAAPTDKTLKGSGIIFTIGVILAFSLAIPSVPIAFIRAEVEQSLRNAQAIQTNKDRVINELGALANSAFEYRALPHQFNGGAGSYLGYSIPASAVHTEEGTYSAQISESRVVFTGTSSKYPSSGIRCAIDEHGKFISGEWSYTGEFE